MKTLVIHPKDNSTDFLKVIYESKNFTILTHSFSFNTVYSAIEKHDK